MKRDAGDDPVGAALEEGEHATGVGGVFRFAEDEVVEDDGGIGGEDRGCRMAEGDGLGFLAGEALGVGGWVFVRVWGFVDAGGLDGEGQAEVRGGEGRRRRG